MLQLIDYILLHLYFLSFIEVAVVELKRLRRRWWVKPFSRYHQRQAIGAFNRTFLYYKHNDSEAFYRFTHVTTLQFQYIYVRVRQHLLKNSYRLPLPPQLRLAMTLQ